MDAEISALNEISFDALHSGLKKVRSCRWALWLVILIYLPGLVVATGSGLTSSTLSTLFFVWVGLLCVAVGMATVVRCPCCHKPFHTNGPTFLPLRKCVHCGLAVNADKGSRRAK